LGYGAVKKTIAENRIRGGEGHAPKDTAKGVCLEEILAIIPPGREIYVDNQGL